MQFVDKALARRLESCEEMPQVFYARAFQKTRPEIGAAEEEICGGHMVFAGIGSPIGRATGAGLDRPLTSDDLNRIEQFYREHKAPSQVDVCPLHPPELFEMFKDRGYAFAELNNVLYRKLDPAEKFPPPPDHCQIRRSYPEEAERHWRNRGERLLSRWCARALSGTDRAALSDGRRFSFRRHGRRQAGSLRRGTSHSGSQSVRFVRCGHVDRISRARFPDCSFPVSHGGCSRGRMRIRGRGHARRFGFPTQCRAPRLPRGLQQSDGD